MHHANERRNVGAHTEHPDPNQMVIPCFEKAEATHPKRLWQLFSKAVKVPVDPREVEEFARQFGRVSKRDGGVGAWPIQPSKQFGTFSETSGAAAMHTDAQYHAHPESAFILACDRPADNGGENLLLGAEEARKAAIEALDSSTYKLLEKPEWSWVVPDVFRVNGISPISPQSPVFENTGALRWRLNNLQVATNKEQEVANELSHILDAHALSAGELVRLEPGDVLYCDNRFALHGRTAFSDTRRLLYRVRLV